MICTIDVGNTNISVGVFNSQDQLIHAWRLETDHRKTADELGMMTKNLLNDADLTFSDIKDIVISSVVPSMMFSLTQLCQRYFKVEPLIVNGYIESGLKLDEAHKGRLGEDRIVDAAPVIAAGKLPAIIIDYGTATTFDYVDKDAKYCGGVIAPGIHISSEALYDHAAKLPRVAMVAPTTALGLNTVEQMQAGLVYGFVGQTEGIIRQMKKDINEPQVHVIATGGLASLIAQFTSEIDEVDPDLTLKGLLLIYHLNKKQK